MQISPSGDSYGQQQRLAIYWGEVIREVGSLPGVESAAFSIWLPPDHAAMSDSFEIQGKTPPDGGPVVPVPIVSMAISVHCRFRYCAAARLTVAILQLRHP
jgi:hypothetical protein